MNQDDEVSDVVQEGWVLKRGSRFNKNWNDRYLVLKGNVLFYYVRRADLKPKGAFNLRPDCIVSNIFVDERRDRDDKHFQSGRLQDSTQDNSQLDRERKNRQRATEKIYCVKIIWPEESGDSVSLELVSHSDAQPLPNGSPEPPRPSSPDLPTIPGENDAMELTDFKMRRVTVAEPVTEDIAAGTTNRKPRLIKGKPPNDGTKSVRGERSVEVPSSPRPDLSTIPKSPHKAPPSEASVATRFVQSAEEKEKTALKNKETALNSMYSSFKEKAKQRKKKRFVQGTKVAAAAGAALTVTLVTAGVGLLTGLAVLGVSAAAGGTGAAAELKRKKVSTLVIAAISYEEAQRWKRALEAALASGKVIETTWGSMFAQEGRVPTDFLMPTRERSPTDDGGKNGDVPSLASTLLPQPHPEAWTRWTPLDSGWTTLLTSGSQGLRIFREESFDPRPTLGRALSSPTIFFNRPCPAMKAHVVLNARTVDAFMCFMSNARIDSNEEFLNMPHSEQRASFRIIETLDPHMDIINLAFRPLFLFPSWTAPRDYVLFRYWRCEPDGSYIIFYDSIQHRECPPRPGFVRGEFHGVYTIAPRKTTSLDFGMDAPDECLITAVVHIEPRGWVPVNSMPLLNQAYGETFGVAALLQLLDVQDALNHDRFVCVAVESQSSIYRKRAKRFMANLNNTSSPSANATQVIKQHQQHSTISVADEEPEEFLNYDFAYASEQNIVVPKEPLGTEQTIHSHPRPMTRRFWSQPDANSFRVRGKTYKDDSKKINAGRSAFRLIAVDLVEVRTSIFSGMGSHPSERVQQALEREKQAKANGTKSDMPPYVVIVNLVLPGEPMMHMVFYYAVDDMSTINGTDGTPFSKLANEFFFGPSDEFRHKTFKLIPQIVDGNFIVRKAVGSKPAIMGKKLRQLYARSDRHFEIVLDISSSSVAAGVIRLCSGYTKELVVDIAFVLEGNDASTLPEKVLGCVRLKNVDMHFDNRFVENPQ